MLELGEAHPVRQLQLRQVHRLVDIEAEQVDLDVLRQIPRQTLHFDGVDMVLDDAATGLDARADLATMEVQRHAHAQELVGQHAQQIHVQDEFAHRMTLQVLEHPPVAAFLRRPAKSGCANRTLQSSGA